ncbi:20010_t:CDS:2, partial [Rhizophagus irregularis]
MKKIEEIEEKNIRGRRRGRGRGKDRGRGTGSSSGSSRGIDHNNEEEQIIQLP